MKDEGEADNPVLGWREVVVVVVVVVEEHYYSVHLQLIAEF